VAKYIAMKIIDPHLHLFDLTQGNYHWLKADAPPFWPNKSIINKSFSEQDLALNSPLTLAGFIHIEAGFDNERPWRELAALEQSCHQPFRAIATIDLTANEAAFKQALTQLIGYDSFVGVRHILDEQVANLLADSQVQRNISVLNEMAKHRHLIFETQLTLSVDTPIKALCQLFKNNPNIVFIINHAGFPPNDINSLAWQHWQQSLQALATFEQVAIKCSGWEMRAADYSADWLNTVLTTIYTIFGANKIMLASNFPLCLFSHNNYHDYWHAILASTFFQSLNEQQKSAISYDNALHWYAM